MEPCDSVSDVLNNSGDMTTDSGMPAVKEVSNFISDALLIHVAFRYIITGTGTLYKNQLGKRVSSARRELRLCPMV